ncbi:K(+)-transporting ATPase subunit F [Runella sp.]
MVPFDSLTKSNTMFTILFILSLAVFGYLVYVLLKPEKF